MFDYIKGTLVSKHLTSYRGSNMVVESGGIGYLLFTTARTVQSSPDENQQVKVFVSLIHKEDSMTLCGFLLREERDIFNILQSVSGVGLKLALLLLNEFEVSELISVVVKQDYKELSRAKGVGPKLAQKMILELKDKLMNWANVTDVSPCVSSVEDVSQEAICEAQNVLLSLGYSPQEAKDAVNFVLRNGKNPSSSEEVLKYTLEYLAQL